MSVYINSLSPTFFQDYYTNFLQGPEPLENILLVGKSDGTVGVESKSSWRIMRFLRRLLFGISYDLPAHIKKIQDISARLLQKAKGLIGGSDQESLNKLSNELVFMSKTCRALKSIVKRVKDRKPELRGVEQDLRTKQYESLQQAAQLVKISPSALCCSKALFSHALAFIDATKDLADVKNYFPELLHEAIRKGKTEKATLLVQRGANLSLLSKEDQLSYAMQTSNQAKACEMIASGARLDIKVFQRPILHYACEKNFLEVLRALLKQGADPNRADSFGVIALHLVTKAENIPLMQALLEYNANVNQTDSQKTSALHIAAKKGKLDLVQLLLFYEAQVNKSDNYGDTPLHFACQSQNKEIIDLLLEKQANVNAANRSRETPLHFASVGNSIEIVKLLVAKGANCNACTVDDSTPLHRACAHANIECARYLLSEGADLSLEDRNGITPLRMPLDHRYPLSETQRKGFYLAFLAQSKIASEWLEKNSVNYTFVRFLTSKAQELAKEAVNANIHPFEIPFLLQDRALTRSIAQGMTQAEFRTELEKLSKQYPKSNMDLIEFSPYEINQAHYTKGKLSVKIPAPIRDVSLNGYLAHFDNLNTDRPDAPYFVDLNKIAQEAGTSNKARLREILEAMIAKVTNKTAFLGTPREGSSALTEFYKNIDNALKNILITLEELKDKDQASYRAKEQAVMCEIMCMMSHCGGRYFSVSVRSYLTHCKGLTLTFEDDLYQSLAEFREVLMQATIPNGPNNVHDYNNLVREIGRKYGLPGYQVFESFEDPFSHINVEYSEKQFQKGYTIKAIVKEWLRGTFTDGNFREKYIDWQKAHLAKNWNKERYDQIGARIRAMQQKNVPRADIVAYLGQNDIFVNGPDHSYEQAINDDQAYAFLSACVMDENTGKLKDEAIYDMLVQTGVFRSLLK